MTPNVCFYLKPSFSVSEVYSVDFCMHKHVKQQTSLLFAHSMTDCDTKFAFYGLEKLKVADLIRKSTVAKDEAQIFTKESILDSGEHIILSMYYLSQFKTLNVARF